MAITIGSDPEVFVKNMKTGRFVSVEDRKRVLIPGDKKSPYEVKGGAIQKDGVAAEFNINPSESWGEFSDNLLNVSTELNRRIKEYNPNYAMVASPVAKFRQAYFDRLPDTTKVLGCDPDFNPYKEGEPYPSPEIEGPIRVGGGHIHVGWYSKANFVDPSYEGHIKDCVLVAQQLDKYLGGVEKFWNSDTERQKYYGKPGAFRPKPYGLEYRPLANAWLNDWQVARKVFYITLGVMRKLDNASLDLEKKVNFKELDEALYEVSDQVPEYWEGK